MKAMIRAASSEIHRATSWCPPSYRACAGRRSHLIRKPTAARAGTWLEVVEEGKRREVSVRSPDDEGRAGTKRGPIRPAGGGAVAESQDDAGEGRPSLGCACMCLMQGPTVRLGPRCAGENKMKGDLGQLSIDRGK